MKTLLRHPSLPLLAILLVIFSGCSPAIVGSIQVSGHYKAGPVVRGAPPSSNLFVVVTGHNSPTWTSSVKIEQRDTTCWNTPQGCLYQATMQNLKIGMYIVSMELQDKEYQASGGVKGVATVLGYYAGPAVPGDSSLNITDPSRADTLVIGEASRLHSITFDIR